MAKILLLNGSARAKQCTGTALAEMIGVFEAEGVETELVQIGGKDVKHAYMIFRVADTKAAEARLAGRGLSIMTQEDIAGI